MLVSDQHIDILMGEGYVSDSAVRLGSCGPASKRRQWEDGSRTQPPPLASGPFRKTSRLFSYYYSSLSCDSRAVVVAKHVF